MPDYELIRKVGSGAYGEVWLARNAFGQHRAVKFVWRHDFGEDERPFHRELQGIRKFEPISRSHPSQLAILHVGSNSTFGCFYYVMELADWAPSSAGEEPHVRSEEESLPPSSAPVDERDWDLYQPHTLRYDLKNAGALPVRKVVELGLALTEALQHLHAQGLVHRDIKPSNIVFVGGKPKLADIGLVTEVGDAQSVVGTEGYLAPEGSGPARADLYSLGRTLYEAAMGRDRRDFPQLPKNWQSHPERASLIEFNEVLLKACAFDPSQRYASAEAMRTDLMRVLHGQSLVAQRRWRRVTLTTAKILATSAAAGVVVFAAFRIVPRESPPHSEWSPIQEASDQLIYGLIAFHENSEDSIAQAIKHFRLSLKADPTFGRAWARLASAEIWRNPVDSESVAKAKRDAETALRLSPNSDEAHLAMAGIKTLLDRNWAEAETHHRRAIELNPNSEDNYHGYAAFLCLTGRSKEALEQLSKAQRVDSHSIRSLQSAGFVLASARQYDEAIKKYELLIERVPAKRREFLPRIVSACRAKGDYRQAIELEAEAARLSGAPPEAIQARSHALRQALEKEGARGYWLKLLELSESRDPIWLATVYGHLNNRAECLRCLKLAREKTPGALAFVLNREPAFDCIRNDSQFGDLRQSLGFFQ